MQPQSEKLTFSFFKNIIVVGNFGITLILRYCRKQLTDKRFFKVTFKFLGINQEKHLRFVFGG